MINFYNITSALMKNYKYLLFMIVLGGVGYASYSFFESERMSKTRLAGSQYFDVILNMNHDDANLANKTSEDLLKLSKEGNNFGSLSSLIVAQNYFTSGDTTKSRETLLSISENKKFDSVIRNYAFLLYAKSLFSDKEYEKFDSILSKLNDSKFFFKNSALELITIYHIEKKEKINAQSIIDKVLNLGEFDDNIPRSLIERFKQYDIYNANT